MQKSAAISSEKQKIENVLNRLQALVETRPTACVNMIVQKLTSVVFQSSKTAAKGAIMQLISVVINSLFNNPDFLLKNKKFQKIITNSRFWQKIVSKREDIASLIVPVFRLPQKTIKDATKLISDLIITVAEAIPLAKKSIFKMMEYAYVLIDPQKTDNKKMTYLLLCLDEAIEFTKQSNFLQTLQNHKKTIVAIFTHYIPAWIVTKTGITAEKLIHILLNPNAAIALKKAYAQYKKNTSHSNKIIKATITLITNLSTLGFLAQTTKHMTVKQMFSISKKTILEPRTFIIWIMKFVPDFMRRTHANARISEIFTNRQSNPAEIYLENLLMLCKSKKTELDPIISNTLVGFFKGLNIEANLDRFIIDGFNFQNASLGNLDKIFSFAKSKILNSNFTGVKFKGDAIDLSGIEIDEASFLTLLPSLKEKIITVYEKFKIINASKDKQKNLALKEEMNQTGFNLEQVEIIPKKISFLHILKKGSFAI